jgi:hypothetical protein
MIALEGRSAIIQHRPRGLTFIAHEATLTGDSITFCGQLRVGGQLRPPQTRTLPLREVIITWSDLATEAVAA